MKNWASLVFISTSHAFTLRPTSSSIDAAVNKKFQNHYSSSSTSAFACSKTSTAGSSTTTTEQSQSKSSYTLNPLLSEIQPSKTVQIFSQVKELEAAGQQITSLCVGEPDFGPPPVVLNATMNAVMNGETRYTAVTGTLAVRTAICNDWKRRRASCSGVDDDDVFHYNPTDIVVANGAKQAVYQSLLTVAGKGDSVLIPAPYWPSYPEQVRLCGATPIIVETTAEDDYLLAPSALENALKEHGSSVKALILCHPSNPTGSVYTRDQLTELGNVLSTNNGQHVVVIADEIYERLTYDGTECPPIALSIRSNPVVTINGFSKAFAMTGFRLGYSAAPSAIAKASATLQSQFTSCASSIAQAAAVAALEENPAETDAWLQARVLELQDKRDFVWNALLDIPGVVLPKAPPKGAFYVLPDVSAYCGEDDTALCVELLQRYQLAIVPGSSFGAPGTVRLSYATGIEELETAMQKLSTFLAEERKLKGLVV